LQTIVQKKGLIKSPYQARQAVVHGHVMIGERVVTIPSYTVKVEEDNQIRLVPGVNLGQSKQVIEAVVSEQPQE
jgi:small subunit ribosomal protein S4